MFINFTFWYFSPFAHATPRHHQPNYVLALLNSQSFKSLLTVIEGQLDTARHGAAITKLNWACWFLNPTWLNDRPTLESCLDPMFGALLWATFLASLIFTRPIILFLLYPLLWCMPNRWQYHTCNDVPIAATHPLTTTNFITIVVQRFPWCNVDDVINDIKMWRVVLWWCLFSLVVGPYTITL